MAATYFTTPKPNDRLAQLWEELRADPVPPSPSAKEPGAVARRFERTTEPLPFPGTDKRQPASQRWRADLVNLFHSLLETVESEVPSPSQNEAISEEAAFSESSVEAAHEAVLALSSPFRWEPKPAWVHPPFEKITDPHRFAPRPRIPLRPLHKQPFYRRILFYLRRWLSRSKRG